MHRTSTNVLGSQMLIRIPTAIQNKAKPATLFTVTLPFHWLLIPFYDSKPVCYADASLFFYDSSRMSFSSSSDIFSVDLDVKRSMTSGTMSSIFVIVSWFLIFTSRVVPF